MQRNTAIVARDTSLLNVHRPWMKKFKRKKIVYYIVYLYVFTIKLLNWLLKC